MRVTRVCARYRAHAALRPGHTTDSLILGQALLIEELPVPGGPTLLCQHDQFRPIFEVHAVHVEPLGAPDESVTLEDFSDGARDPVAPFELPVRALEKFPVIGMAVIDVDRCRESMHR